MKGRGGCGRSFGHESDLCQAKEAEKTEPRTNAVKYATARDPLNFGAENSPDTSRESTKVWQLLGVCMCPNSW